MDISNKCLKCGGTDVSQNRVDIDRNSGTRVSVLRNLVGGGLLTLIGGGLPLRIITINTFIWDLEDFVALPIIFAICCTTLIFGVQLIVRYFKADKKQLFQYKCQCGHQWEKWEDGWDSIACPKCSKQNVTRHIYIIDLKNPESGKKPNRAINLFGGVALLVIGFGLISLAVFILRPFSLQVLALSFLAVSFGVQALRSGGHLVSLYFGKNCGKQVTFRCAVCGHSWKQQANKQPNGKI